MKNVEDLYAELNSMKESLSNVIQELKMKDINIESLKHQIAKAKQSGLKLADQNSSLQMLKEELDHSKTNEALIGDLLHENRLRIHQLKMELRKRKETNTKLFHFLTGQTKKLEKNKILLEESKLETTSLHKKFEEMQVLSTPKRLQTKLELAKENLNRATEGEKNASLNTKSLLFEVSLLKSELNLTHKVEENNKMALDELALALQEIASEISHMKDKLMITEIELEHTKKQAEESKLMANYTENKYKLILEEAKRDCEELKNNIQKLKLEAEESVLGWNEKEVEFVNCMKKAEREKIDAQEENKRLTEMLTNIENLHKLQREENAKLFDIVKQGLNEADSAKEAKKMERDENCVLKNCLIEKDEALDFLAREYEKFCDEFHGEIEMDDGFRLETQNWKNLFHICG